MSNATQDSHNSGESRRRRSRGGSNRHKNQNQENRRGNQGGRRDGDRSQGPQEFRPQASRPARVYSAPKLSWWQKILSAIGLYKAPAAPGRPERKVESAPVERKDARAPKSNTRNARTGDSDPREKRPEGDRPPREPRAPREGGRSGDRPRGGDPKSVESTRVYVGNLSYDVTEQDLQELFKGIGGVRNVEIVYNRSTHRSKGYGFVEMLRMDEAIRAVEVLNDQFFMGRKMTVSGAKSKGQDEREDKDERPAREPKPVVVASTSAAEVAAVEASEPGIEGVVESAASPEAALEGESVAPAVSAVEVNDLEAKDGSEPEEKASDAPSH